MKRMSFSKTTAQMRAKTKTVTRRLDTWLTAKPGERVLAIEKGMGLKKGQKQVVLGSIEFVSVTQEPLQALLDNPEYGKAEMAKEGFPELHPLEFIELRLQATPDRVVTRLEFKHLDPAVVAKKKPHFYQTERGQALAKRVHEMRQAKMSMNYIVIQLHAEGFKTAKGHSYFNPGNVLELYRKAYGRRAILGDLRK